ncbi:hypothetical protein BJ138DRAFT_1149849 [Hygrophoropsis aurantiaca]|uniref:Uncharacterized protein n=1 Tax=Hygrophoropsis aurantiaca TaxID=72124 RepID=A0ACB8AGA6_9AGAM|nr:hypothetical protein BJ138DRAFT_1149849 [Hygrophoropsis aurantiaca]
MQFMDLNEDIIFYILEILLIKYDAGRTMDTECWQPDLAALARTCRTLKDPSLDVLWRTQYSFSVQLVKTLPVDALEITAELTPAWGEDKEFIFLKRTLLPSDWERFFVYASRIKHLFVGTSRCIGPGWKGVHHSTFCALAASSPTSCLLPNLSTFNICCTDWILGSGCNLPSCLATMFHQDLRSLKCEAGFSNQTLISMFDAISHCHQMKELVIEATQALFLANMHPGLSHLQSFKTGEYNLLFSLDALFEIGMWDRLVELEITISRDFTPEDIICRGARGKYFPALRRLSLATYALPLISAFIAGVQSTQLEDIHLDVYATFTPATLPEVYDYLTQLRSISVIVHQVFKSRKRDARSGASIFTPLIPFRKLRTVKILSRRVSKAKAFTAADIAVIPQAWPNLEFLDLGVFCSRDVTLSDVADLATRCPRLWKLCNHFDATSVPDISAGQSSDNSGAHVSSKLRVLDVADSPVKDPERVVAFFSQRFPNIEQLICGHEYEYDLWDSVRQSLDLEVEE